MYQDPASGGIRMRSRLGTDSSLRALQRFSTMPNRVRKDSLETLLDAAPLDAQEARGISGN